MSNPSDNAENNSPDRVAQMRQFRKKLLKHFYVKQKIMVMHLRRTDQL